MNNSLVKCTLYVCEQISNEVTEITLFLGYPEQVSETESRAPICISVNAQEGSKKYAFGADKWQALMIAISMLKLKTKLSFRKKHISFHYTRENAEQQTEAVSLDDVFPKDY